MYCKASMFICGVLGSILSTIGIHCEVIGLKPAFVLGAPGLLSFFPGPVLPQKNLQFPAYRIEGCLPAFKGPVNRRQPESYHHSCFRDTPFLSWPGV